MSHRSIALATALAAMLATGDSGCGNAAKVEGDREADAMQERGSKLLDARRYDDAANVLRVAFDRHRKVDDHAAASSDARQLSRAYRELNRYSDALRWAETGRSEAVESGDEAQLGRALHWLGNILQIIGDGRRAVEVYTEAARYLPENDRLEHARMKIYRAIHLLSLGRSGQAEQLLEEARDLAREAGDERLTRGASINLADLALDEGRLDDAERHLRDARAACCADGAPVPRVILTNEALLAQKRGDLAGAAAALDEAASGAPPEAAWGIAVQRGIIAESADKADEAERRYRESMAIIEEMRRSSTPTEVKAPFLEERWQPFQLLFALQLGRGDARGAFATLAQAQGRMFLDTLAVSLAEARSGPASADDDKSRREQVLEQVVPLLASSPLGEPLPPETTLAALRGRQVRQVLAYFAAAGRMRLVLVADGEPRLTGVDVDLGLLDRLIDDFRARPEDEGAAAALGAVLLPPGALPRGPGRLHVIPTGKLLRVPFAALRVGGERLLDRYEVTYVPSVIGLAAIADQRGESSGPGVVVADSRSDLRNAAAELRAVVAQTGAIPRTGKEATTEALRAAAGASLLHVISHSGLDDRGGYLSLADRKVTAAEILAWRIRPRLAVLPTCASAATVRGEMWDSLAAAFLAAGSEHVVATLVSVQDSVGADFTRLFYQRGGLLDPVGATTRAQREMAKSHSVADWSPFVVAGP